MIFFLSCNYNLTHGNLCVLKKLINNRKRKSYCEVTWIESCSEYGGGGGRPTLAKSFSLSVVEVPRVKAFLKVPEKSALHS